MDDARREMAATLGATDLNDAEAALRALGCAFRWAAAAVRRMDGDGDSARALGALYDLDDALEEGRELVGAVPALLAAAMPGESVGGGTDELVRQLAEAAERVAAERVELKKRAAAEEELRTRLEQHEELRRQVDELRRLERLVDALDALREQQRVIADRLAALRGKDAGVDVTLRTSSDALIRLSDDRLAALGPQTRQVLERAAAVQSELAAEERTYDEGAAALHADRQRLEQIQTERAGQLASLRLYALADRDLARALTAPAGPGAAGAAPAGAAAAESVSLEQVEAATADIERRLRDADAALGRVLEARDSRDVEGRTVIRRTGGG
ncbi:hypothetical protein [Streptomyces sp. NPDC051183]|uniref:hypothetical protein n=1 Tax=unclassified Streptomyces TaxID=2593676 RepID=UPI00342C9904